MSNYEHSHILYTSNLVQTAGESTEILTLE